MNDELPDEAERPSKTRLKQEAHEQQELGERLARLKPVQLVQLNMPDTLLRAIEEYQRLPNSFAARKRQLQFIGRIMREIDAETLSASLDNLLNPVHRTGKQASAAEQMADSILFGNSEVIEELVATYHALERQALRQFFLEYQRSSEKKRPFIRNRLLRHLESRVDS